MPLPFNVHNVGSIVVVEEGSMIVYVYCFTIYLLLYMYVGRLYSLNHILPYTCHSLSSSVCQLIYTQYLPLRP